MKKIIFCILLLSAFGSVQSQNISKFKNDSACIGSVVYQKVDSLQFAAIFKIEERYNSFYARNRLSQTFYVLGLGFFGVATLIKPSVSQKFTNLTTGIGVACGAAGLCFYLDSFNYFNPKKKNKKKDYFDPFWSNSQK